MTERDGKTPNVVEDPDAPPSADEIAASERLRRELENPASTHEDALLARALKTGVEPAPLSDEENRALIDRALERPEGAPTPEEIAESERLRQELDDPGSTHPDVLLARSLRLAVAPKPIEAATHRKILDRVLGDTRARRVTRGALIAFAFAAAAAVSFAVIPLRHGDESNPDESSTSAALIKVHSVDDLFSEPYPKDQLASARIDRIAEARARDLRFNKFAKWGVH